MAPAVAAAWMLGYATAQVLLRHSPEGRLYLSNVAYNVPILVAVLLCARAAVRVAGRQRAFWALIATSCGLWLSGELSWAWYELVARVPVPFPALPDVFYIASYLPSLCGFVLVFREAGTLRQWRALLDASVVTVVVGAVGWAVLVAPSVAGGVGAAGVAAALPPMLDLATVVIIGTLGVAGHRRLPGPMVAVTLAYVVFAATDAAYAYFTLSDARSYPGVLDLGWQAVAVLIAVAAVLDRRGLPEPAEADSGLDRGLPLVLAGTLITLAAMVLDAVDEDLELWIRGLAVYVVLAVIARLLLTSRAKDRLTRELARSLAEQERLAVTDGLTGLYNRRFVEEMLRLESGRAVRSGGRFGVLVVDVDHFKAVNDSHGHEAGDEVLRAIADRLVGVVRRTDAVGRYGGEEFVVLLPGAEPQMLAETAERCRRAVADAPFLLPDGPALSVSVSVGAAALPDHGRTARELVRTADRALYLAKATGRNRVRMGAAAVPFDELDPAAAAQPARAVPFREGAHAERTA